MAFCEIARRKRGLKLMGNIYLKEYEKRYLKHLMLLFAMGVLVAMLCLLFKIKIHIAKSVLDNLAWVWSISMFLWFALLNAFSSDNCILKPYPFWYYIITILNLVFPIILIIRV